MSRPISESPRTEDKEMQIKQRNCRIQTLEKAYTRSEEVK